MTVSLDSSETATTGRSQDRDPEALGKALSVPTENDGGISEKSSSPWEVTLDKSEDPKNMSTLYKWATVLTVSSGAMCVTSASSMVSLTQEIRLPSDLGPNTLVPSRLLLLRLGPWRSLVYHLLLLSYLYPSF
jgi:hypothetical protein